MVHVHVFNETLYLIKFVELKIHVPGSIKIVIKLNLVLSKSKWPISLPS
jgi:hypothetical protein